MRDLDAAEIDAIQARTVVARDFVWLSPRDRATGEATDFGFWSDVGTVTAEVRDGLSGTTVARAFVGAGGLVSIGSIRLTADLTVRRVDVALSPLHEAVQSALREYDPRGAPVQIYRGFFDPATRALVAPAKPRFVGLVDTAPIVTPAEGGEGSATLSCASRSTELYRANPEVRSDASQRLRSATDNFYQDVDVVGSWQIFWGAEKSTVGEKPKHPFLARLFGRG